ncbi:SDR family NAD(P)-dependent oxidoreductase [Pyrococcus abyssi]|uniref:3-oxoacyl-[acyl-carrier-protein] reductase n=1 Tax=Pyrococcus abyssi (strain GE5 / Orsay) TaxID=272844 RepID=Q9UY54_PYRAB|nr:3-oxoacyl-ACP reductase family protein [Pyrococcus abyssi]CAB50558.1 Short-chain alcohol dehydrogenase, putative glucose-1-dehydrogenase [Pyrococcus abyssi GE5]CCE71122.1 TPA: 3-oxoacyl-[acyl-carrier-protein] reductase [Pyrococcus abyssi GE5]
MELKGKVALITGASRGIGRAIAIELAKRGVNVVINYRSNEEEAKKTEELCRQYGVETLLVKADVSNREEVREMVKKVIDKFGRIDILINNAGILGKTKDPLEVTDEEWDRVISVNLKGAFIVTQEVLRYMKKGKIVNIASIAGKDGGTVGPHYAASKGGLIALTFNLARHLAPNILVNAVAPGPVDTDMLSSEMKEMLKKLSLTGDIAKPSEVAHAVIFLLENDHITGEVIDVNGGRLMD